jgi:NADPH-dependent glutamate synthase beta subunit-like oxidoreductase
VDLKTLEKQCVQEEPPYCRAACPLQLDARKLCGLMAGGKFGDAYRLLERAMPLPEILGRICDAPCRVGCKRGEIGDPVALPALERACVMHAPRKEASVLRHGSGRRVIVLGGGPSGLVAASDLSARACEVLVITPGPRIGARLCDIGKGLLPKSVLKKELSRLAAAGVKFEMQHPLDDACLTVLIATADAVFIGLDDPDLPAGWWRRFSETSDPKTLETPTKGLFCGGFSAVNAKASFVFDMAEGRKGALSIDRFLKGISLTADRPFEGVRETRLCTDIRGIEPAKTVSAKEPKSGYSLSEAALEAKRCLQCECLVCARACDYLSSFGGYPLKFAREFENFKGVTLWRNRENQLINSCSLCGLCETLCPEHFPFPEVCREARISLVERRKMPPSFHEFALMDMAFSTGERAALVKNDPVTG